MRDDERGVDGEAERGEVEEIPTGFGVNAGIVEEIRQRWELDPESVDESWSEVFEEEERPPFVALEEPGAELPAQQAAALAGPQLAEEYVRVLRLVHAERGSRT